VHSSAAGQAVISSCGPGAEPQRQQGVSLQWPQRPTHGAAPI